VASGALRRAMNDGDAWFSANFNIRATEYQHYYMYALERYLSFRELAEGSREAEPAWYNQGVTHLGSTQAANGSWQSCEAGPVIDTAFAVLFLLRSTKRTIHQTIEETGRLQGGKRLPPDVTQITINPHGQVVDSRAAPPVESLLEMLDEAAGSEIDTRIPQRLELSRDPATRAAQLTRLRRMAMGGGFQARLTAVNTLGRDRNLDNVPALIYALSDPAPAVVRAARDGLRFISRKVDGFGLADQPEGGDWRVAQQKWKQWYLSVNPGGVLVE
jgi:hypothetical protein